MTHYGSEELPDRDPTPPYEKPDEPNNCTRCNASMPSWRVNSLCEECYAEESDQYDDEAELD